jgi:hypothetical protein
VPGGGDPISAKPTAAAGKAAARNVSPRIGRLSAAPDSRIHGASGSLGLTFGVLRSVRIASA